jgi:hypothetical protein
MNTLLVYPKVGETFWIFRYALRVVGRKSAFPPLGALTVAAMLPLSWHLKLVDLNVRPLRAVAKILNQSYYWRLLKDGFSKYRQAFSDVVTMSIYGYHFRKLFWSPQVPLKWEDWRNPDGDHSS